MPENASYRDFIPVFETLNEAIVVFDHETILWVNEPYLEMMGYTADEIIGRPLLDRVHPDETQEAIRNISSYTKMGSKSSGVWRIRKKDGTYLTLVSHTSIIPDHERTVTVSIVRPLDRVHPDPTHKITEAGLHHEVQTSLTLILGYLELLQEHENVTMSPELERWFSQIHQGIQRINDVFTRLEDGTE